MASQPTTARVKDGHAGRHRARISGGRTSGWPVMNLALAWYAGSEGKRSGIITEAVRFVFFCRSQKGLAQPVLFSAFETAERLPGHAWASPLLLGGLVPVCHGNSMDKLAIENPARLLQKPGYPMGMLKLCLIIEVEGSLIAEMARATWQDH